MTVQPDEDDVDPNVLGGKTIVRQTCAIARLLQWRGAARDISDKYRMDFLLLLDAMRAQHSAHGTNRSARGYRLELENALMRLLISLIVIVYLVGVGVALSPTIRSNWNTASASDLATTVGRELPNAVTWPAKAFHTIANRG
jgi:hypothetical protein